MPSGPPRRSAAVLVPEVEQGVVVVAGNEHDLGAARQRVGDRMQHRRGGLERVGHRPVAQLERVAEQHEPVRGDRRDLVGQGLPHVLAAQHVGVGATAQVQVRDDEGAHASADYGSMPPAPLDGVLVADFSRVLAGPLCTQTLADLGADVVKVERPGGGDDTRSWGPSYFLGLNGGKRSVVLDLKDPADVELAAELVRRADVVVESFRPGVMERLGLGPELNPGAVWCSVTAFGASDLPGYDLLLQAVSGLMHITGEPDGRPLKVGAAVVDLVCGLHAAVGILAALRSGEGARVEVNLMDAALVSLLNQASAHLNDGAEPHRLGNRHPAIAPYETFGDLAVACGNDAMFARLCDVLGVEDLPGDERFATNDARVAHRDALAERLEPALTAAPPDADGGAAQRGGRARPVSSTTSRERSPSRRRWGSTRCGRTRACARCAHRCGGWSSTARARRSSASTRRSSGGGCDRLADLLREHEADVLLDDLQLRDILDAAIAEPVDERLDELLGRRCAGRDADDALAVDPLGAGSARRGR